MVKINEDAYLSKEEEDIVFVLAMKNVNDRNMSLKEQKEYLSNFPHPRMFAQDCIAMLGEEKYKERERKNIELIRKRVWENG